MAHIPDGILAAPVLVIGGVVSAAGCALALRRLDGARIPEVAVLSAVFFVGALIHFPVGPTSVHLILNGLTGVVLGSAAWPAIVVGVFLQAVMFGFGGVIALGSNALNMALPAVVCGALFDAVRRRWSHAPRVMIAAAGVAGSLGVGLTALMVALSLAASGREFELAARLVGIAHLPVMVIEGVFTAAVVSLLLRARPGFLERRPLIPEEN